MGSSIWPVLNGISTLATIANVIGMVLLLAEWGQLLRFAANERSRGERMISRWSTSQYRLDSCLLIFPFPMLMDHRIAPAAFAAVLCFATAPVTAQELEDHWWQPNDTVYTVLRDPVNDRVYLGGSFTYVGPNVPYGALVDAVTSDLMPDQLIPNGPVRVAIPDGTGGFYLGGSFTKIGDQVRYRLARINADGSLHPWAPQADNTVHCLHLVGDSLFVGGAFTTINSTGRTRIAAIGTSTGQLLPFATAVSLGEVRAVVVDDGLLYIGGTFTNAGGQPRNRIAEIDMTTGLATAFNANANGPVNALALHGDNLIAGGGFFTLGGLTRNSIGEVERATGFATSWNALGNDTVHALLVQDDVLFVAGRFTSMGGISRARIAALDIGTAAALAWSSETFGTVRTMAISGGDLFYGGDFSAIAGEPQNRLARVSLADGTLSAWSPNPNGHVLALAVSSGKAYVGGVFTSIGGVARGRLAVLDGSTGMPLPWAPSASGTVRTMALADDVLYVGGDFTSLAGVGRNRLAAIDVASGIPTAWAPSANARVRTLAVEGTLLYVGGDFTSLGGETRTRIASLVRSTGNPTPWIPSANGAVHAIATANGNVHIAGAFGTVNGVNRRRLAALDANAQLTTWNPDVSSGDVNALVLTADHAFVGGTFTTIGGEPRGNMAAVELGTGAVSTWDPGADGAVHGIALQGNTAFIAGGFQNLGQVGTGNVGVVDLTSGLSGFWTPAVQGGIRSLQVLDGKVYLGGSFTTIGGMPRRAFAVLADCTPITLYADGDEDGFGDAQTEGQFCWPQAGWTSDGTDCDDQDAALHPGTPCDDGDPLTTDDALDHDCTCLGFPQLALLRNWMVPDGAVHTVLEDTVRDVLYIGGEFEKVTYNTRYVVRLNSITAAPILQLPEPNGPVLTALPDDAGGWYIGGDFTELNGIPRNRAAHILADGSVGPWDPDVDGPVRCFLKHGANIYIGGDFEYVGGLVRPALAAVDIVDATVRPFALQELDGVFSYGVEAMTANANTLYIGGAFDYVNGVFHPTLAAVNATTGALLDWDPFTSLVPRPTAMHYRDGAVFVAAAGYPPSDISFFRVFDADAGEMLPWPNANGSVNAMVFKGDTVLIAGSFSEVGGVPRQHMAALDINTAELLDWDPGVDAGIDAMTVLGDVVYLGGDFTQLAGAARSYFGAIDLNTNTVLPWDPNVTGIYYNVNVDAIVPSGEQLLAHGDALFVGTRARNNAAALDMNTGVVTDWDPGVEGVVNTLAMLDSTVYLGGAFTNVGGAARNNLAAVDTEVGAVTAWNPSQFGTGSKLAAADSVIYVGGPSGVVALGASSGLPYAWNPAVAGTVTDIVVGDALLVAGSFTTVRGQPRNGIASIDRTSGEPEPWNPNTDAGVSRLLLHNDKVYATGAFTNAAGTPRNGAMNLSVTTGTVEAWNPAPTGTVSRMQACGPAIILGGNLVEVGGQPRDATAAVNAATGAVLPWVTGIEGIVHDLVVSHQHEVVCMSGNFYTSAPGYPRRGLAVYGRPDCAGGSGQVLPGTPCDDNNPNTINDTWTEECTCQGELVTSLLERDPAGGFNAWPNPAHDVLNLSAAMTGDVLDVYGRVVAHVRQSNVIPLEQLATGAYLFRATDGGSLRFVKQ